MASRGVRNASIDAIRLVGVVAIIVGHVWSDASWRPVLYAWHVPVFFVLTGYLWKPGRSTVDEIKRRGRSLMVPYAAWLILIGLAVLGAIAVNGGGGAGSILSRMILGGSYIGRPFSAFWFVTALFAAAVLLRLFERLPVWVAWVFGLGGLACAYVWPEAVASVPLAIGSAFASLVFVLAGRALRNPLGRVRRQGLVGAALLVVGFVPVAFGSQGVDIKSANFGLPVVDVAGSILISAGLILLAAAIYERAPDVLHRWTTRIALTGFMVILTHAGILWVLHTPSSGSLRDFTIALVVPILAALLIMKTPAAPILTGVRRSAQTL